MTENEAIEALERHKKDCRRCKDKACKYGIDCLQKIDIAVYEELLRYRTIGTVEEFRKLKEKDTPKKITHESTLYRCYTCPSCKNVIDEFTVFGDSKVRVIPKRCKFCGQRLMEEEPCNRLESD